MKLVSKLSIVAAAMLMAACAPRDTTHYYSIQDALNSSEAKEIIDPSVKLYFGKPAPGKVIKAGLVSNKKTNAANKSDEKSCQWANHKVRAKWVISSVITKNTLTKAQLNMNATQVT